MKRGKLKAYAHKDAVVTAELEKQKLQAQCKHKFIDSKSCLKCGWVPPPHLAKPAQPFSFRVTVHENTRLRVGDVVFFDGVRQVVCQVNSSSARITPLGATTKTVTFTPRFKDTPVTFNAPVPTTVTSISANSECEIIERLGRNWKEKLGVNPKG